MQEFQDFTAPRIGTAPRVTQASVATTAAARPMNVPSAGPLIATQHVLKEYEIRDQKDRGKIGMVEGAGGLLMIPFGLDFMTALLSKVLTLGGTLDATPWGGMVNGALRAPFRALRTTELQDIGNFGNRWTLKRQEFNARGGNKGKGAEKLAARAEIAAEKLKVRGDWKPSAFGDRVEGAMSKGIRKFAPLRWLDDKVAEFANWRSGRLLNSAKRHLMGNEADLIKEYGSLEAAKAKGVQLVPDLDVRMQNPTHDPGLIGRKLQGKTVKPIASPYSPELVGKVAELKGTNDPAKFAKGIGEAIDLKRNTGAATTAIDAAARKMAHGDIFRNGQLLRHAETAGQAAAGYAHIGDGKGSAIAKAFRALPKGLGRASLLHVAFGAGAVLMTAAKFMDGKRENRLEGHLIKDFAADVYGTTSDKVTQEMLMGKDAHPLVAQVAKAATKAKKGRGTHNALHAGFEVVNVATLKGMGAAGMAMLPWYGVPGTPGLEQLSRNMLIGENSALVAYQQLSDADKGKIQLPPEEKVNRVRFLIASIPGFATKENHGVDNRLVEPMAQELVSQGLNAKQILQAVANPEQMVALATTVRGKLEAKEAEAKAAEQAGTTTETPPTMNQAAAPSTKVSMAEAVNHGRVETREKAQSH